MALISRNCGSPSGRPKQPEQSNMHIVPTFQGARTGMEKRVVREKAEKNEATETVAALGVNKEQRAAVMFV